MRTVVLIFLLSVSGLALGQFKGEIRKIDGTDYKVHLVQSGETLYALSREYGVPVNDLLKANPKADQGLSIGQEVLVPVPKSDGAKVKHTVDAGETLFSISKKYGVDIDEIMTLNEMEGVDLSLGQVLIIEAGTKPVIVREQAPDSGNIHVVSSGETLYSITRKYGISEEELKNINGLTSNQLSIGQKLILPGGAAKSETPSSTTQETPTREAPVQQTTITTDEKEDPVKVTVDEKPDVIRDTRPTVTDEFVETVEEGVAELIPDTENTRKYLALHRTVKSGTIIRVRNEMNGREVWARVIGKLPDTGDNTNILVKVSKAAYDRLGAVDKKFRVTITYIP